MKHLEAGRRLLQTFEYRAAQAELLRAAELDQSNQEARTLLIKVNDVLDCRRKRIQSAVQSLAQSQRNAVQERLVLLDNRLDWGNHFVAKAQSNPELNHVERIWQYQLARDALECARELIKWLPVGVNVNEQQQLAEQMISETERAIKALMVQVGEDAKEKATVQAAEPHIRVYPLWDGKESIETYAWKMGLKSTETIDLGNGAKMELKLIPPGRVGIRPFYMGKYEERRTVSPEDRDPLRLLLAKSDLVARGTIVRTELGVWVNDLTVDFRCEFKVSEVCKGEATRRNKTIDVIGHVPDVEGYDRNSVPFTDEGTEYILFLKKRPSGEKPVYILADHWLGVLRPRFGMLNHLKALVEEEKATSLKR